MIDEHEDESEETELNKQKLIEKWEAAIESAEFYGRGREDRLIEYMRVFVSDLRQLDELEVLSQEWIDEHVETTFDLDEDFETEFIKVDDLQNLLVPKQEEMKVSKMWHDVIVQNKEDGHSLRWTLNYIDNLNVNDVDSFAKAWIAYPNIEVEEEQKYYLKMGNLYLAEPLGDMTSDIVRFTRDKEVAYQFTDEKSIATHLDKFKGIEAVKVEEMEEND